MKKLGYMILGLLALVLIGGFSVLAFTDVHAPQTQIDKTIPNDHFFQTR